MAKKSISELIEENKVQTIDLEVILLKEWTNPEGGKTKPAGHKLTVTPELAALMESQGVIILNTKNN